MRRSRAPRRRPGPLLDNPKTRIPTPTSDPPNPRHRTHSSESTAIGLAVSRTATVAAEMVRKPTRLMPMPATASRGGTGPTIDHGDRDEAGSAHDRAGTHHRAHTPSLDLSPLHRPDEGGLARGPEDDGEEGLRPAELISEFHGEIPEPWTHTIDWSDHTTELAPTIFHPCTDAEPWCRWWAPPSGIVPSWSSKHKTVVFVPRGFLPAVQRPPLKVRGQLRDQLVGKPRSTDELAGSGQRVVIAWGLV